MPFGRSSFRIARFTPASCLAGLLSATLCASSLFAAETPSAAAEVDLLAGRAEALAAAGKTEEAQIEFGKALDLARGRFGSFHPITAGMNRRLAKLLLERGNFFEAERCLQKALVIVSGYSPAAALDGEFRGVSAFTAGALQNPERLPGTLELADVLEGYAELRARQGRYADAERLLKTSSGIYGEAAANKAGAALFLTAGDSRELLLRCLLQLAAAQAKQSKVSEAEQNFQRAVALAREQANSTQLGGSLRQMAAFYREQGRNLEADTVEAEAAALSR